MASSEKNIELSLGFDTKDAEHSISDLSKKLIKAFQNKGVNVFQTVSKDIETTEKNISEIQKKIKDLFTAKGGETYKLDLSKEIADQSKVVEKLAFPDIFANESESQRKKREQQLAEEEAKLAQLEQQSNVEYKTTDTSEYKTLTSQLAEQKNNLQALKATAADSSPFKRFGASIASIAKTLGNKFKKNTIKAGVSVKNLFRSFLGARTAYALIRKLLSMITTGFKDISKVSNTFKNSWNTIQGAFKQIGSAVSAAAAPLINVLAPIIANIASLFTRAANSVAQFFAVLSGQKSVIQAAVNTQKYAEAVNAASSSTNKALGAYDKLNVIQKGEGANPYSESSVTSTATDLADKVKQSWENADFTEIGKKVGEQLQVGLQTFRDNFLVMVDEFGINLASSISTFLNGFGSVEGLAADIGTALTDVVNIILHAWDTLVTKLDYVQLGSFITEGIQSFIFGIDWGSIGHNLFEQIANLFDLVAGFIAGIDWFNLIQNILTTIWNFISAIDWAHIAESIGGLLGSVMRAAIELVVSGIFSLAQILYQATDTLGEYFVDGFWEGILRLFSDIGTWIKDHIFTPFIEGFKKLFGINSPSKVMSELGGYLVDGLFNGIGDLWSKLGEKFEQFKDKLISCWNQIKLKTVSVVSSMKSSVVNLFTGLWTGVKKVINSLIAGVEKMANGIVRGVNRLIDAINSISIDVPDWVTDLVGIDTIGFNLSRVSEVSIPRLAQGAVIPPNKEFMAVLGDQSSGTNIEAPLDTIKQALAEVMSMYGGNTQPIILQLDGKTVAKVVWDENKKRYKQTGKNYAY